MINIVDIMMGVMITLMIGIPFAVFLWTIYPAQTILQYNEQCDAYMGESTYLYETQKTEPGHYQCCVDVYIDHVQERVCEIVRVE